jgi:hypothetical protein
VQVEVAEFRTDLTQAVAGCVGRQGGRVQGEVAEFRTDLTQPVPWDGITIEHRERERERKREKEIGLGLLP